VRGLGKEEVDYTTEKIKEARSKAGRNETSH
jgi:hypothetical protein